MKGGVLTTQRKDDVLTNSVTTFKGKALKAIIEDAQMDLSYVYCACGSGGACGGGEVRSARSIRSA